MKNFLKGYFGIAAVVLLISCADSPGSTHEEIANKQKIKSLDSLNFAVEKAPEWSALFRRKSGWFGGDGIFCVALNGKEVPESAKNNKILFWFSDTMLGEIINDSLKTGFEMINNSAAFLTNPVPDTNNISFFWNKHQGKNIALFLPQTPNTKKGDYYWLGDGFINQEKNNDLYIFGYRIQNTGAAVFGFKEVGNTLIIVPRDSKIPFTGHRQIDIPFFAGKESDTTGTIGCGVYVNTKEAGAANPDGYLYIYGLKGKNKQVIVARIKPADIESFDKWKFWDGNDWHSDISAIATIADRASNELGLMQLQDGRYALVFQTDGMGKDVALRLGKTPAGPFGPIIKLWDCSSDLAQDKDFISYNAKVHPVLSKPDELIISYNINSFDFANDIKRYPDLYRPRFIRVKVLP